jgi:endonuclease/exonuclease/phosphatase family metal-dependent hydrolase
MILFLLAVAFLAADETAQPAVSPALRVATFNIRYGAANDGEDRWEKRKDLLLRTIAKMDADVIGMQEVVDFQFDELQKAMPEYEFVGVGRNDGKRAGEFVPVCFKSKKFEKVTEGHFWLSEEPDTPGSKGWDAALPRVTTWVRLRDRATMKTILFVSTHFDHKGPKAREESAKLLRARVESLAGSRPAIVVGDFNATEDGRAYANLLGKEGDPWRLTDSFRSAHPKRERGEGTFHGFTGDRQRDRIDWIVHTSHFKTISSEIVYDSESGHYPSDHFPVTAVLEAGESK